MNQALAILGLLPDADLEWMASVAKVKAVKAGEIVIHEGQAVPNFLLILEGRFAVSAGSKVIAKVGRSDVLGEMSLIDSRPASATVAAEGPGRLMVIGTQLIRDRLMDDANFAARFYRALAMSLVERLRQANARTAAPSGTGQDDDSDEELSPEMLDELALAGKRVDWLLRHVRN